MDLYVVLGLRQGAKESEIKRAYRRLARRFIRTSIGDRMAETRFKQILEAYETLSDPDRRSAARLWRRVNEAGQSAEQRLRGFDFSGRGADYSTTFGDLFAEVLTDRVRGLPPSVAPTCITRCGLRSRRRLPGRSDRSR